MMGGLMGGLMAPNNMQGMFKDAGLGGMMGGMLGGQGLGALGNPNMMKSLENGGNPFKMLGGMGSNMTQQLAGLMGMQGMGMPSMGGMGGGMPINNSQLSSMWGGMPGRSMGSMERAARKRKADQIETDKQTTAPECPVRL